MESKEIKKMVWCLYYLGDRKQVVSKNGFNFDLVDVKCGVSQGSILRPILFLIYINDLHLGIK